MIEMKCSQSTTLIRSFLQLINNIVKLWHVSAASVHACVNVCVFKCLCVCVNVCVFKCLCVCVSSKAWVPVL